MIKKLALIFLALLLLPAWAQAATETDTFFVAQTWDDCMEAEDASFDSVGVSHYLGISDNAENGFTSAVRFTSVTVPAGSDNISSASLTFPTDASCGGVFNHCNGRCYGEDADNSAVFTTGDKPGSRDKTTAYDDMDIEVDDEVIECSYVARSFDVKTSVQEIVDRGGWSSGNNMSFLVTDNMSVGVGRELVFWTRDDPCFGERMAVRLIVEYAVNNPRRNREIRKMLKGEANEKMDFYARIDPADWRE